MNAIKMFFIATAMAIVSGCASTGVLVTAEVLEVQECPRSTVVEPRYYDSCGVTARTESGKLIGGAVYHRSKVGETITLRCDSIENPKYCASVAVYPHKKYFL